MRAYVHVQRWGATGEGLDPLINRIARNLLIDRHRRVAPHLVSLEAASEVHDTAPDLDDQVLQRQRNVEVRSAVSELPERHRTALMYSLKGMTPAEVGDKLGIGRNAADALLHRARRSLRERLRHVGEGMLGFGFWLGQKVRNGSRRAGLDEQVAMGGVAVSSGAAVFAATALAVVVAMGGGGGVGGGGGMIGGPSKASVTQTAPISATTVSGPTSAGPVAPAAGGGHRTINLGPASTSVGGPRDGHYTPDNNTSVGNPNDSQREILGVAPDVFEEQDPETFGTVCGYSAGNCESIYKDPRP
jgi:RNA polymerase sigma factor (sigma-70 family)